MGFDISSLLRNRNVFGPSGNTQQQTPYSNVSFMPPPQRPNIIPEAPVDTEGPSEKAYREFLANPAPARSDFHPTKMDRFGAIATGIAAGAKGDNGFNAARNQLDQPFQMAAGEYASKQDRLGKAAKFEGDQADTAFKNKLEVGRLDVSKQNADSNDFNRKSLIESRATKAALSDYKAKNPNHVFKEVKGGNIVAFDPQNPDKPIDTGINTGTLSDQDKIDLQLSGSLQKIDATGKNNIAAAGVRANIAKDLVDYKNENKPITNSSQTMMEGAKMLRPHITELKDQATQLEKDGLFGPIMGRIRNAASKIGTTGTPEEIESSLQQFADNIMSDPSLNQDARVGQFATMLGLTASAAGRVHGGARGGGSIQMINYMKSLLSSDSTLPMFLGRLNALDAVMKGYEVGPNGDGSTIKGKKGSTAAPEGYDPLGILGKK